MSTFNLTEQQIKSWGGETLYNDALKNYYQKGEVANARFDEPCGEAEITHAGAKIHTRFKVGSSGLVENMCPCAVSQRDGRVCVHIVAAAVALLKRAVAARRIPEKKQERSHAEMVAKAGMQGKLIKRDYSKGQPAEIRMRLPQNWHAAFTAGEMPVSCHAVIEGGGNPVPLEYIAQRGIALKPGRVDDMILFVLEDIQGDMTKPLVLTKADFVGIVDMLGTHGRPVYRSGGNPLRIEKTELESKLVLDLDRDTGEILLMLTTDIPGAPEGSVPEYAVFGNKGFAHFEGVLWPLKSVLPGPYQKVYQETIAIPRKGTLSFIKNELGLLEKLMPLEREIDFDLFLMQPAEPRFSIRVKGNGASISMTLFANYNNAVSVAAAAPDPRGDFSIPDEEDFYLYYVRNMDAEKQAIKKLRDMHIAADSGTSISPLSGERPVLNFLGTQMPVLERDGWSVQMDNEISSYYFSLNRTIPVVEIEQAKGAGSFEIGYAFRVVNGRANISPTDIHRAIQMHESFVKKGDDLVLFDMAAIEDLRDALRDCNSEPGTRPGFVRISNVHAPYIKASLDALDKTSIRIQTAPQDWKTFADKHNRLTKIMPVILDEPLKSILRPYQKDGIAWLRFLESNRLGGILADEMGLGKTLQTLTWLALERFHPEHRDKPALVVCPTSLVDNWVHEAQHFTPELKVIAMSGAQRHEKFERISDYNLVVTSYALIRRDVEEYRKTFFSAIILDEAQNIKNRATQNATAVKLLSGGSRFVLTGTPMENSVADLWSIMDFLMPGYLGHYDEFRASYEIPLSVPGDALYETTQVKLRRKLHPFLLRRKKNDVAKDLPPKIVKVSWCNISSEQQVVYDKVMEASRREIRGRVEQDGYEKSRMVILTALLRLRQVCCHLELLGDKNPLPDAESPSAKLEQFFEIYDEAANSGHRILVFSQFVSMLKILRRELEKRNIRHCYLDGASKDRLESVHKFNTDTSIPVFLISLKAGGTGLNLTGADTVVHFDPWWNPAVEDQATDRAHRIGQKKTVLSLKMITENTIEEKVLDMQRRKRAIIGATVESDDQIMAKLTWDDVKELFDL